MSLTNPFATKTDDVSTLTALEVNTAGSLFPQCLDIGGGTYATTGQIDIGGTGGLKLSASGTANKLKYGSRSKAYVQSAVKVDTATPAFAYANATVGATDLWTQAVIMPNGCTVTAVSVSINPADDTLPTTKATLLFKKHNFTTGVTTTISTTEDPAVGAAYQALHSFGPSGLTEVIDRTTYNYFVAMIPESGGDTDDYEWHGTIVTATITEQDDSY